MSRSGPQNLGKRDSNEREIVSAWRKMGVKVLYVNAGALDLVIKLPRGRGVKAVEIKNGKRGRMREDQDRALDDWGAEDYWVIWSLDEAIQRVNEALRA